MLKTAFLFPGQGAQYTGMGKPLFETSAIAREIYEQASDALHMDMKKLCFEESATTLEQTELAQPAILTTSVAAFRHYTRQEGWPCPQYLAGHSLGEYTALCCAGALDLGDALRLVRQRGKLMQEAVPVGKGSMAAINDLSTTVVEEICRRVAPDTVWIAAYNLDKQVTIAGYTEQVSAVMQQCSAQGAEVMQLKVSAPFHTPLMQPAADLLLELLSAATISPLQCAVLSNGTGAPYASETEIVNGLYRQMTNPVQWLQSLDYLQQNGVGYFIDAGPRKLLRNQVKNRGMKVKAYGMEDKTDIKALLENVKENIAALPTPVSKAMAIAISTKNWNEDEESYEKSVILPFREMKQLQEKLEQERRLPQSDEVKRSCQQLLQLLQAKRLPVQEMKACFRRLYFETGAALVWPEIKEIQL